MARTHHFFAAVGLSLLGLGTGCVSSEKYNAQRMRADQANEQLNAAESHVNSEAAKSQLSAQQAQQFRQMLEAKEAINQNLQRENQELQVQLTDARHRYDAAMASLGKAGGSALPVALVSELTAFAQQNPDVVEFDDKKGLIKFKSDVTFSAGSAVVKPEAKAVIDRFAGILNGPAASQYELMVVGHTDNVPVSNPNTKKAGHHDNWYLSAHRAIAVSQALQAVGTAARRIQVAGCADQRPVAANDKDGQPRNRRVEVFILPTTLNGSPAPSAAPAPVAAQQRPAAPAGRRLPNKETATTDVQAERKPFDSK